MDLLHGVNIHLEQGSHNLWQIKIDNLSCFSILAKLFCHKSSTRSCAMFEHIQICIDFSTKNAMNCKHFFFRIHTTASVMWKHESQPGLSCYCSQISNIINIQWTVDKMFAAQSRGTEIFRYFFHAIWTAFFESRHSEKSRSSDKLMNPPSM